MLARPNAVLTAVSSSPPEWTLRESEELAGCGGDLTEGRYAQPKPKVVGYDLLFLEQGNYGRMADPNSLDHNLSSTDLRTYEPTHCEQLHPGSSELISIAQPNKSHLVLMRHLTIVVMHRYPLFPITERCTEGYTEQCSSAE